MSPPPRRCVVLQGEPDQTRAAALRLLSGLAPGDALWVGEGPLPEHTSARPGEVRRLLGQSFDAAALDLHAGLDADLLGQCHGFIRGGGALILRLPPPGAASPVEARHRLALWPHPPEAVTDHAWERALRILSGGAPVEWIALGDGAEPPAPLAPAPRPVRGTTDQRAAVASLAEALLSPEPAAVTVLADRGRGKSSAIGLAIRAAQSVRPLRIAISAGRSDAADEIFQFAQPMSAAGAPGALPFVPPVELAAPGASTWDAIAIDEAARLPVPLLQRIARRHPTARLIFATTVRGYEGTGRGFALRFLRWLEGEPRPLTRLSLSTPIRWGAEDPLERLIFDLLALDAAPVPVQGSEGPGEIRHARLDRGALARDEALLRQVFGLLVGAHYRTTPGDLTRLLDAPNLDVHALFDRDRVVAAALIAREGGLPAERCEALARGRGRIRGHALADTLITHGGRPAAGQLQMIRSVRTAVHPALRRQGLARRLVEAVHASYSPDLFGTMFGATPALLRFRRATGYALVRVGGSRGDRTGEPAAVMIRPVSAAARALVSSMREDLARDLPLQAAMMRAEGELGLEAPLIEALSSGLPAPTPLTRSALDAAIASYLSGPRTSDAVAAALRALVEAHPEASGRLSTPDRALIQARVLEGCAWREVAARAGLPGVTAAQRRLRRAIRALVDAR